MAGPGMSLEQLMLVLRADLADWNRKLEEAQDQLERLRSKVEETAGAAERRTQTLGNRVGSLIGGFANRMQQFSGALAATFIAAAVEAGKSEDIMERLRIVLTNQGAQWNLVRPQIDAFTSSMSRASQMSSETFSQALLLATSRGFDLRHSMDLVDAAMKVSIATGQDVSGVLSALIRGTQGYARQLVMMGIITADEAKRGVTMADVLQRINQRFGETAKQPVTVTRALRGLAVATGELLQVMGLPTQTSLAGFINGLTRLVQRVEDFVKSLPPATVRLVAFISVLFGAQRAMGAFTALTKGIPIIGQLAQVATLGGNAFALKWAKMAQGIPVVGRVIALLVRFMGPIGLIIGAVTLLHMAWSRNWFGIRDVTTRVVDFVVTRIRRIRETIAMVIEGIAGLLRRAASIPVIGEKFAAAATALEGFAAKQRELQGQVDETVARTATAQARNAEALARQRGALSGLTDDWKKYTVGGVGPAGDAAQRLEQQLRKAIETQKNLFTLGRVGLNAVVQAYEALINNAKVSAEARLAAEVDLASFLQEQAERRVEVIRQELEANRVTYQQAVARIARIFETPPFSKYLSPEGRALQEKTITAITKDEWNRRVEAARDAASRSVDWIDRMVSEGKLGAAELAAAFDRIRERLQALNVPIKLLIPLLEALGERQRDLTRQVTEDIKRLTEETARELAQIERDLAIEIAEANGDKVRALTLQEQARFESVFERIETAKKKELELIALRRGERGFDEAAARIAAEARANIAIEAARRVHAENMRRIQADARREEVDARLAEMRFAVEIGTQMREALFVALQQERAVLEATGQTMTDRYRSLVREIIAVNREIFEESMTLQQRAARGFVTALGGVGDFVRGIMRGTKTVGQSFRDMLNRMLDAFDDALAQMIQKWAQSGLQKFFEARGLALPAGLAGVPAVAAPAEALAAQEAAAAAQLQGAGVTLQAAAVQQQAVATAWQVAGEMMSQALQLAADRLSQAAQSLIEAAVSLGAGEVGGGGGGVGAAFGFVRRFLPFQAGGMVRPPTGAQVVPALLHAGEEVLLPGQRPSGAEAERVRVPAGVTNVYIQAIDTQTGMDFLFKHRRALGDIQMMNRRANHLLRRQR